MDLSTTSYFHNLIFLGESAGKGLLQMVLHEHLLPRQHDGQFARAESPQGRSSRTSHDEPCVQVFSQTSSTDDQCSNTGVLTTQNRGTISSAFTTRTMCLPYTTTIPQGA